MCAAIKVIHVNKHVTSMFCLVSILPVKLKNFIWCQLYNPQIEDIQNGVYTVVNGRH